MHELNPPIFTPAHATKSRGLFNGFHQLHSFSKVLFFPPCCTRFFFFHQHLPRPPSHPSLIFILSSFFFFFLFCHACPFPSPLFPAPFQPGYFPSLPPSLSVLPFLSLMGSPANTSPSPALLSTISSLIAVKLMKWSTGVTPFPPLRFPYLRYLHLFAHPVPFSLSKHLYYSRDLAVPSAPTLSLYFSWF